MNILNKLTIKHLTMNKKRTLVTIFGIILSTALMVGIGLLMSSFLESMKLDAIKSFGSYNTKFISVDDETYNRLKNNVNVKESYYTKPIGYANIKDTDSAYWYINSVSDNLFSKLELTEGEYPKNDNEIVIGNDYLYYKKDIKIGDTITLDVGSRISEGEELDINHDYAIPGKWVDDKLVRVLDEIKVNATKTYKVVGFVNDHFISSYSSNYYIYTKDNNLNNNYNVYLEFSNPSKTFDITKDIVDNLDKNLEHIENTNLLYYYGATKYDNINKTMVPLIVIALAVISVACIIVIYNSFAISTMERKKSFGLYASIGATNKQIKKTVLFEALIVGIIGVILGIIGAFIGIYIVVRFLNYLLAGSIGSELIFHYDLLYIGIPLIFMVFVIFLSAYLPAKRASRVTPIEAIRQNDDIKISKKEVKTPKFIKKIFGIEGDIAFKNIKRNKKKYRITVISLFISIVLFNTFTCYLTYALKGTDAFVYYDYDLSAHLVGDIDSINKDVETLKKLTNKGEVFTTYSIGGDYLEYVTGINKTDFTQVYQNYYLNDLTEESQKNIHYNVIGIEDDYFRSLTDKDALLLNKKYVTTYDGNNRYTKEIQLYNSKEYDIKLKVQDKELDLNALVYNDNINGLKESSFNSIPVLVISKSTYLKLIDNIDKCDAEVMFRDEDYEELEDKIDNDITFNSNGLYINSPSKDLQQIKNIRIALKLLFYGFISLVTLIGVTSVINTINTNINLRRKEFAMLRSVGLTPKGFNKLLFLESLFFGLKSLIYGLPVSFFLNYLICNSISEVVNVGMIIPWTSLFVCVGGVFLIVLIAMYYSSYKVKKENILEALREENI